MRKIYSFLIGIFILLANNSNAQIVISQVYGGGGNSGATYTHDYVELFNRGTSPVNITGWSLQYTSSTGTGNFGATTTQITQLPSVTIQPGQYFLVQQASNAAVGLPLPTPDFIDPTPIPMAAGAGKIALVNTITPLGCNGSSTACSAAALATIVDLVGYGTGTNFFEGTGPTTPAISATLATFRLNGGCTDNNNNSTDFSNATPNPRNSASPLNLCFGGLSINNVSQAEGNSGTTSFTFTVTLSSPADAGGVTFDISTQDNTATIADNDYATNSLTGQTIPQGQTQYSFTVLVNGDATAEANETFFVNVTNVTGAVVTDGQGLGTILNDDCPPSILINQIQGSGNTSPLLGNTVTTTGIVIGIKSNGFFIQSPDAMWDADANTSEGIFVFTSSAPPASVAVGNNLCVTGTVAEFIPAADPYSLSLTEITSPTIIVLSTGNPLPAPSVISMADANAAGSLSQLEKFEGMRVVVNSMTVVAPTGGTVSEANATSTTNGFFYGVVTGVAMPFREPGIITPDPVPAPNPPNVPIWDANPELIGVESDGLGAPAINVATGAVLTNVVGPLDFGRRTYTIFIDPSVAPVVSNNNLTATPVPAQTSEELTVASFNMERFYDNVNDPGGDAVLTATAFNNRLNKVSLAIRNVLKTPDVIGAVEVENLSTLQAIANKVNNDAVLAGDPNPNYQAYLVEGNDVGLIDVGFLVKSVRVNVVSVTQYGLADTYINPLNGQPEILNDRPPLVLNAAFNKPGCATPYPFTVIVNHLRSLNGVDDAVDGVRIRAKRNAQAEFLANLIQTMQSENPAINIISVGDFNAFQFNDGLVDVIGTIKGTPTPADQVVLASTDLVNPDLVNLIDGYTASQRYSFVFEGSHQVLDHILVNQNANAKLSRFSIARVDADFPEIFRSDASRPERISDHDAPVAYFLFTDVTPPVAICKTATITLVNGSASITASDVNNGSNDECSDVTLSVSQTSFGCSDIGANTVTLTVTDGAGNTSTCSATVNVIGVVPSCTIAAVPSTNVYTGGVATNIYLGYGPQSVTLNNTPVGAGPFTYSWTGSNLSCTTCEDPVFTPTTQGVYTFTVTVTNSYGCTTTCTITICVLDIRVPGTNGKKVYLCHAPPENPANISTLEVSVNSVAEHLADHAGDKLGQCGQDPCAASSQNIRFVKNKNSNSITGVMKVTVLPNPSKTGFTLKLESESEQPLNLRILDLNGKELSRLGNLSANTVIRVGDNLMTGFYLAEIIQGQERKVVKLIKIQ